ncbi:MAG: IS1595 family transposase, partial [Rhizomicrobium sp.]
MNILELFQSFQTPEQAVDHLEKVRWHGRPVCPYCHSEKACRHVSGDRANQRWQCQDCTRAFSVTVGTIFHGTHIPLKNWFLVLALMLNAKKSASAYQIARDLGMRRPTVWSMMHRVRVAMSRDPAQSELMYGIVEAYETYIGGKPRKGNR